MDLRITIRHKGFTLIELLVVIAIIAILAAILFPIFANAKDSGKRARCAANERQLVMSLFNYIDDNAGRLPTIYVVDDWHNDWWKSNALPNWGRALYPYVQNYGIYKCPNSQPHTIPGNPRDPRNSKGHENTTSYLYNGMTLYSTDTGTGYLGKLIGSCRYPARTCALRELMWDIQMAQAFPDFLGTYVDYGGYHMHTDGANYCFYDGHIKYLKQSAVPKNASDQMWDFDNSFKPRTRR